MICEWPMQLIVLVGLLWKCTWVKPMKGVFTAGDHCGQLGYSVTGQVGDPLWNMPHSYPSQGARKLGCSSADSHLSFVEHCFWGYLLVLQTCPVCGWVCLSSQEHSTQAELAVLAKSLCWGGRGVPGRNAQGTDSICYGSLFHTVQ